MGKVQKFQIFLQEMQYFEDYLKTNQLKDGHSYIIWARNAYVGIWSEGKNGFHISRHKVGDKPFLACEYHWDYDDLIGTAKPLKEIEKCPSSLLVSSRGDDLLYYLNTLEDENPVVQSFNSRQHRKNAASNFKDQLAGQGERAKMANRKAVWEYVKDGRER